MTQEERDLLLQDLSARLPYGVKVEIDGYYSHILKGIDGDTISTDRGINYPLRLVKPYLRKMSSMTEEERKYYIHLLNLAKSDRIVISKGGLGTSGAGDIIDYLISHHFDYRGLISMGLAIEAPEGMYK